jgi:hypothetical protein
MLMLFIHRRNQIRDKVGFLAGFPPTSDILKINIDGAFLQKEKMVHGDLL